MTVVRRSRSRLSIEDFEGQETSHRTCLDDASFVNAKKVVAIVSRNLASKLRSTFVTDNFVNCLRIQRAVSAETEICAGVAKLP